VSDLARVRSEQRGPFCVVRIEGEIDLSNAPDVASAIEGAMPDGATELVVDLTDTTYLDSSGVGLLVRLAERLRHRRRRMQLVVPEGSPIRVALELCGIPQIVPVATRVEELGPEAEPGWSSPGSEAGVGREEPGR
jgi:anti-anti-sigma factor